MATKQAKQQAKLSEVKRSAIAELAKAASARIVAAVTKGYDALRSAYAEVTGIIRGDAITALEINAEALREYADLLVANTPEGAALTTVKANASNLRRLAAFCSGSAPNTEAVLRMLREGSKLQTVCEKLKVPTVKPQGRKPNASNGADKRSAAQVLCEAYDALSSADKRTVIAHILARHVSSIKDPKVRVSLAEGFEQIKKVA